LQMQQCSQRRRTQESSQFPKPQRFVQKCAPRQQSLRTLRAQIGCLLHAALANNSSSSGCFHILAGLATELFCPFIRLLNVHKIVFGALFFHLSVLCLPARARQVKSKFARDVKLLLKRTLSGWYWSDSLWYARRAEALVHRFMRPLRALPRSATARVPLQPVATQAHGTELAASTCPCLAQEGRGWQKPLLGKGANQLHVDHPSVGASTPPASPEPPSASFIPRPLMRRRRRWRRWRPAPLLTASLVVASSISPRELPPCSRVVCQKRSKHGRRLSPSSRIHTVSSIFPLHPADATLLFFANDDMTIGIETRGGSAPFVHARMRACTHAARRGRHALKCCRNHSPPCSRVIKEVMNPNAVAETPARSGLISQRQQGYHKTGFLRDDGATSQN
jgi:hypothetical protein